ncbi:hypothetical protein [Mycolicibacterium llatzerense]|uniref:hypothetical protein n=1 Tax=Mycolicibacterium llatzerense TaxID=280871 RepID=UPI0008DE3E68|nr:hypothetical protein [Mycolicibacterium llatzerense]
MSDADDYKPRTADGRVPSWTEWTRNQRIGFVAFVVFLFAVVMPVALIATYDPSKLIDQGGVVEPGWGRKIVYIDNENPQIRCTATTSSGELLALEPFAGANRRKALGSRRNATKYWAVAVLPTDLGPLHISCQPNDSSLWITAPDDNTGLYIFLSLMGVMTTTLTVGARILRKRRRPREV